MQTATVTIGENGSLTFLNNEATAAFLELGEGSVQRASHVEPENVLLRKLFHALRLKFGEYGYVASFTRLWPCLWRVNTSPVGGPILDGRWRNRTAAIAAEIEFLNDWFLR